LQCAYFENFVHLIMEHPAHKSEKLNTSCKQILGARVANVPEWWLYKMRLFSLLLFIMLLNGDLIAQKPKGKFCQPVNIEEACICLNQLIDDTTKYNFMLFPEDVSVRRLYFSIGMNMRNVWGLHGNSDLSMYFKKLGVQNADDASSIIITSFYRFLHNKPIQLDSQIALKREIYRNVVFKAGTYYFPLHLMKRTPDSVLVRYYPVGDTVIVYVYAEERKFFAKYASSLTGTAIVQEQKLDKLLVRMITLQYESKKKAEYKVGDVFETDINSCYLIPSSNKIINKP
jgi:hypothetical protein